MQAVFFFFFFFLKVTRRACHRGSRSDAIAKDGSIENCRSRRCAAPVAIRHTWMMQKCSAKNDERHPPCFHESPEQRDVALPVKQKPRGRTSTNV
jgi:hypothetical protein